LDPYGILILMATRFHFTLVFLIALAAGALKSVAATANAASPAMTAPDRSSL